MNITINDIAIALSPSSAEIAALSERRAIANAAIESVNAGKSEEEKIPLHSADAAYLEWAVAQWAQSNPDASADDIRATAERALRSWAGTPPPDPPAPEELSPEAQHARLVTYAAERRWRAEVGGVSVNGIAVPTDDRAKLLLLGAAQSMADGSSAPLVIGGVSYGTLTKAQFQGVNAAVVAHVQATFATLAAVLADIAAEEITTTAEIDAAFA